MPRSTSCGDDLTRSTNEEATTREAAGEPIGSCLPRSHENLTTCHSGEKLIESLPPDSGATDSTGLGSSSGSNQDVSDCPGVALSKMTRNVVWIFLIDGDNIVFTCSGIPIECNQSYIRVLISANLAKAMRGKKEPGSTMKIEARDAFNNVAHGSLDHRCLLYHGIGEASFVQVTGFLDVCEVNLSHAVEIRPHGDLVTMKLTVESGGATPVKVLPSKVSMPEGDEALCKSVDGGPLFDDHGNFVGMNIFSDKGRCVFVEKSVIVEKLRSRARQERYRHYQNTDDGRRRREDGMRTLEKRTRRKFTPY